MLHIQKCILLLPLGIDGSIFVKNTGILNLQMEQLGWFIMIGKKFELHTRARIQVISWERCTFSNDILTILKLCFWVSYIVQRGCCIRSPLVTKLFEVVLFREDVTQRELKNSSHWNTCDLSPHRVSAMSVHYFWRYEHFSERQRHFLALRFYTYLGRGPATAKPAEYYNYNLILSWLRLQGFHDYKRGMGGNY